MIRSELHWLGSLDVADLRFLLQEYRYFVHRFPMWLALASVRSPSARVRALLLPNLLEEAGASAFGEHLLLLDRLLLSCGVMPDPLHTPLQSTRDAEQWFFDLCATGSPSRALCALGPGTESVSSEFLEPLEEAIEARFAGLTIDRSYFDAHREEVEGCHARDLLTAVELSADSGGTDERDRWVDSAIAQHAKFWNGVRNALAQDQVDSTAAQR